MGIDENLRLEADVPNRCFESEAALSGEGLRSARSGHSSSDDFVTFGWEAQLSTRPATGELLTTVADR